MAGGEQLGAEQGQRGLLHDERLVVRPVRLRDRGAPQRAPRRTAVWAGRRADPPARLGPHGGPRSLTPDGPLQPRPMNGILVAVIVMNWTLALSGKLAMYSTASATC